MTPRPGDEFTAGFHSEVCRIVLRPIIGILLRIGMSFASFSRIARSVYVEVASQEFGSGSRPANNSRVAVLTGLSRARVREELKLLALPASATEADDKVRPASRVLLGWHTDQRFVDDAGHPADLDGEAFHELYDSYSGKVVPMTAMLKELLNVGAMEMTDAGKLRVLSRSFTPHPADPAALRRVCMAIADLATTGGANLFSDVEERRRFERFATNQLVPVSQVEAFRDFLELEGQAFLERMDDWMADREQHEGTEPTQRIGVGVYQITPIKKR